MNRPILPILTCLHLRFPNVISNGYMASPYSVTDAMPIPTLFYAHDIAHRDNPISQVAAWLQMTSGHRT